MSDDTLVLPSAREPEPEPEPGASGSTAGGSAADGQEVAHPRPRTRWAAIVWGLAFAALALGGVWLTSDADRLDALSGWVKDLEAGAAIGYALLAVGVLLLVGGLAGLLRRAQVAASRR